MTLTEVITMNKAANIGKSQRGVAWAGSDVLADGVIITGVGKTTAPVAVIITSTVGTVVGVRLAVVEVIKGIVVIT